jgi:hypothetical protein
MDRVKNSAPLLKCNCCSGTVAFVSAVKPSPSNGCCTVAYSAVIAWQWVYMRQYFRGQNQIFRQILLDITDELQFFPLAFSFDICYFEIYGTLIARINHIYKGLRVLCLSILLHQLSTWYIHIIQPCKCNTSYVSAIRIYHQVYMIH